MHYMSYLCSQFGVSLDCLVNQMKEAETEILLCDAHSLQL